MNSNETENSNMIGSHNINITNFLKSMCVWKALFILEIIVCWFVNRAFNISDLVINVGFVFLVAACLSSTPFDEDDDASMAPTSVDPSVEPSVEASKE